MSIEGQQPFYGDIVRSSSSGYLSVREADGTVTDIEISDVREGRVVLNPPIIPADLTAPEPTRKGDDHPVRTTLITSAMIMAVATFVAYGLGKRAGERTETKVTYVTHELPSSEKKRLEAEVARLSSGVDALLLCGEAFGIDQGRLEEHFRQQFFEEEIDRAEIEAEMGDDRSRWDY
ncbi:MAG: hypothetical protein LCH61_17255 [Proteobacteria bacterium]|nr:hypothetical protein [Pseudomonadota bacterium]